MCVCERERERERKREREREIERKGVWGEVLMVKLIAGKERAVVTT